MSAAERGGYARVTSLASDVTARCETCVKLRAAERDKEEAGDLSAATDCRVLLRRHAAECRVAGEGAAS
ncbi:hypothetical protein GL263_18680 [Streptomyces durbertensis]|uniref:Ferredoxin n=1 Tax=Streptomyces durbertensis TaxID=2448886 RepID=A0ABR6EKD1_9ACTN|nr:hypothetical protein [Streptomyces durbertensis]MBB1245567.1 hypothetical protein [Streptomyces durbertensis]